MRENDVDVVIVSSDKDMLQLVDDRVSMYNPVKEDVWYDPVATEAFMGVKPTQVADLLALKGDSIDNIPGAPGIGDKGARDLIAQFGSVEAALDRAAEVQRKMYRESLREQPRAHSPEQASRDHRHYSARGILAGRAEDPGASRRRPSTGVQRAGVFQPGEANSGRRKIPPPRDYATFESADGPAGLGRRICQPTRVLALAVDSAAEGELPITAVGLSARPGQGRALRRFDDGERSRAAGRPATARKPRMTTRHTGEAGRPGR